MEFEKPGGRRRAARGPLGGLGQPAPVPPREPSTDPVEAPAPRLTDDPGPTFGSPAPSGVRFDKPGVEPGLMPPGPQSPVFAQPEPPTYELASWGRRAMAAAIDGAIVLAITIVPVAAVVTNLPWDDSFTENTRGYRDVMEMMLGLFAAALLFLVVIFFYAPVWMWRTNGRTLGKQLLGIRVVRADGQAMGFWYAVFREFLVKGLLTSIASSFTLYLYGLADVLWPLWDSENRAVHDHIANSRVVRG